MSKGPVIAIDGPSGSGKSTAGRELARRLGLRYVDSGAMYRAVGLSCLRAEEPDRAVARAAELARELAIDSRWDGSEHRLFLDGEDVSEAIRAPEVSGWASRVSVDVGVRSELVSQQRALAESGGLVMDGRDIGTAVFPDADVKFYLDADVGERGRRRRAEEPGSELAAVTEALESRDRLDSSRAASPLRVAEDAICIDTTTTPLVAVVELMLARVLDRLGHAFREQTR